MKLFLLFAFASYGFLQVNSAQDVIPVSVYYESLCPDSIAFFTTQLFPAYTSPLKRYFNLTLVVYGKSHQHKTDDSWEFECHHGPNECYGNTIQACSLKHFPENEYMKLINCLMSTSQMNRNAPYPTDACGTQTQLDVSGVVSCANKTSEGANLLAELGDKTSRLLPALSSVPTIVFNENYNTGDQKRAVKSFKSVLCSYIKGDPPHECKNLPSNSNISRISLVAIIFSLFFYFY